MTKAPKLKKENGLIDWSRTAEQVCDQIRAMQPWPTAYTFLHRRGQPPRRIIVHRAGWYKNDLPKIPPGGIILRPHHEHELHVASGPENDRLGSEVEIFELQPAGKRRMEAIDFLRGHPLQEGDFFGPETP